MQQAKPSAPKDQKAQKLQSKSVTPAPKTVKPPNSCPKNQSDEFLKRKEYFKKFYKDMNNGIRDFFNAMIREDIDIDQVLDTMDYVEEGDRRYKKDFISSL